MALPAAALMLSATVSVAAPKADAPQVDSIQTGRDGSRLFLNMRVNPQNVGHASNKRIEITPIIVSTDGADSVTMPSVTLAGTNMYYSALRNSTAQAEDLYRAGRGESIPYEKAVEYQDWMQTCRVSLDTHQTGCCGNSAGPDLRIPIAEIDLRKQEFCPKFAYIAPLDTLEKRFDLSGRANIRFIVNRTNIDWTYANNYVELDSILRTVNAVKENPDASVESITLTGYASPEGPYSNNVRLANGRTEVVKEYVRNNASFPANIYHTAAVPEDWQGLREWLVNSEITNRDAMIAFIDDPTVPIPTKNDIFMKKFPKEYPFILANVYPPLRHTDYRITYIVKKYLTVEEIREAFKTRPRNLSLNEFFILANSYEPGSPDYDDVFAVAVEMYPDDVTANLNAANSAMNRHQWERAAKYLDRAGNDPYAVYGRGVLYALQKKYADALPLLKKAEEAGVAQASEAIEEITKVTTIIPGVHYYRQEVESLTEEPTDSSENK